MIILGVDPGTATTGFGIIEQLPRNRWRALDYGVVSTKSHQSESNRLLEIYRDLKAVTQKYKPDLAGVEKLYFTSNQKTAMSVAQARGVIMLLLAESSLPIVELTPLQIKSYMTGYGKARKDQIQRVVQKELNLKNLPRPDDAADALAIALSAGISGKL